MSVAINVSPQEFEQGCIVERVAAALGETGLDASRLEIEVTENLFIANVDEVARKLHRLRDLGVRVVMDDFGTGYSSLQNLWRFPFDKLKVDRSCFLSLGESESVPLVLPAAPRGEGVCWMRRVSRPSSPVFFFAPLGRQIHG